MEQFFPVEIPTQKVHLLHALIAGTLNVMEINQFGDTRKRGVGSTCQQSVLTLIQAAHINRRRFMAD